jgi:hypothetical protein
VPCRHRMLADFAGVISPKPVWGQCAKRMLLGALSLGRVGYDVAKRRKLSFAWSVLEDDFGAFPVSCVSEDA